jgi:hypothetical protein
MLGRPVIFSAAHTVPAQPEMELRRELKILTEELHLDLQTAPPVRSETYV